jgi:YD repeat-containing protein
MAHRLSGIITIVQEGRFQMTDDDGVSHLFILSPRAAAETEQLAELQNRQARLRVRYNPAGNLIGNTAIAIYVDD